jgi:SAM-dependent methyltransferase
MSNNYHPEPYWSEVAKRIKAREGANVIAGDDEPYYRYKRNRFLEMLSTVDFKGKSVLEIGNGPGGNLDFISHFGPKRLVGVDISSDMIELATKRLGDRAEIIKVNGTKLPFEDKTFDIVFSATVLQHNTDEKMLLELMSEMCRVSGDSVILFERIEDEIKGDELCYGRPVSYYSAVCQKHGFELVETSFINIRSSYYVSGAIRKGLNPKNRVEGEPLNAVSVFLQNITLPITKLADKVFTSRKDVAKLHFKRK